LKKKQPPLNNVVFAVVFFSFNFFSFFVFLLLRCDEEGKKKPLPSVVWEGAMAFAGTQQKCKACEKTVYFVEQLTADGVIYHKSCFRCNHCKGTLKVRPALGSASVSLSLFLFLFHLIFASFATSSAAVAASSSSFLQFVRVVGLSGRVFASLNLCCILWLLSLLSTVVDSDFEVFDSLSLLLLLQFAAAAGVTMSLLLLSKRSESTYNRARTRWLITTREPDLVKKA
jgi:hypothetical protein